jgi:hypothetical protein
MSSESERAQRKIINWKEYNQALVNRGSITFWFDRSLTEAWYFHGEKQGRGCFKTFSDTAIQHGLMLKSVFKLPLRALEGFTNSMFKLLNLPLSAPDYSLYSKRARQLSVTIPRRLPEGEAVNVVFDSSGLKVYGEGEWKVRRHGAGKRRRWMKLHVAVNPDNFDYIGVQLSEESVGDSEVLPQLLEQLGEQKLGDALGDGAYDSREDYAAIAQHGGQAVIPPRKNAAYWESGHPRNVAVAACRTQGRKTWKQEVGYHRRSLAETAVYRFKQLIGPRLRARNKANQAAEVYAAIAAINYINTLGLPVRS